VFKSAAHRKKSQTKEDFFFSTEFPRQSCNARSKALVFLRRRGWRPRAAITALRPKGTFMKAGSAVPLASAAQARAIIINYYGVAVYTSADQSSQSCQIVQTRHPKTTRCQHKLVTTHQLSVAIPTNSCPKKPH